MAELIVPEKTDSHFDSFYPLRPESLSEDWTLDHGDEKQSNGFQVQSNN